MEFLYKSSIKLDAAKTDTFFNTYSTVRNIDVSSIQHTSTILYSTYSTVQYKATLDYEYG